MCGRNCLKTRPAVVTPVPVERCDMGQGKLCKTCFLDLHGVSSGPICEICEDIYQCYIWDSHTKERTTDYNKTEILRFLGRSASPNVGSKRKLDPEESKSKLNPNDDIVVKFLKLTEYSIIGISSLCNEAIQLANKALSEGQDTDNRKDTMNRLSSIRERVNGLSESMLDIIPDTDAFLSECVCCVCKTTSTSKENVNNDFVSCKKCNRRACVSERCSKRDAADDLVDSICKICLA